MTLANASPLLISQYANSARLRAVADIFVRVANSELEDAVEELDRMRRLDTAAGVWLDAIGERLGLLRPSTSEAGGDERLGFSGATDGAPFDTAPFAGAKANEARFPLPDVVFRKFIRARARQINAGGSLTEFAAAAREIDPAVSVLDNLDMSLKLISDLRWQMELAVDSGALVKPAGVRIRYADRARLGFDDAGLPLDQGLFEVA